MDSESCQQTSVMLAGTTHLEMNYQIERIREYNYYLNLESV